MSLYRVRLHSTQTPKCCRSFFLFFCTDISPLSLSSSFISLPLSLSLLLSGIRFNGSHDTGKIYPAWTLSLTAMPHHHTLWLTKASCQSVCVCVCGHVCEWNVHACVCVYGHVSGMCMHVCVCAGMCVSGMCMHVWIWTASVALYYRWRYVCQNLNL